MKSPIYTWDEENKVATCTIEDDEGRTFTGVAKCHPSDFAFGNQYTGSEIAMNRAAIKYLQSLKRDVLKPGLAALQQLYYSVKNSQSYNKHDYVPRMLYRQIRLKQEDINVVNAEIKNLKDYNRSYITEKDNLYRKLEANRKSAESNN